MAIKKHKTKIGKVPNILRKPVISPTSIPQLIPNSSSQSSPPVERLPSEIMVFSVFYLNQFKCLTKKTICDEISRLYSSLTKDEINGVHSFLNLVPSYLEAQEGSRLAPTATLISYASLVLKRWMVENLSLLLAHRWMDAASLRKILPGIIMRVTSILCRVDRENPPKKKHLKKHLKVCFFFVCFFFFRGNILIKTT